MECKLCDKEGEDRLDWGILCDDCFRKKCDSLGKSIAEGYSCYEDTLN